jgi:cytidylate kinase
MIIAIDGPAGSGKSTVAKLAAARLGFAYLDTGAMYRAVALLVLEKDLDPNDHAAVAAAAITIATTADITFGYLPGEHLPSTVLINGRDVTQEIRTPAVDVMVSPVSATPEVRTALVTQQRRIGAAQDTVMEGRDIGTVVFPHAELKVFLTASAEVRAKRRAAQNARRSAAGTPQNAERPAAGASQNKEQVLAEVLADIKRRDKYDSERAVAPLVPATDSILVDTTDLHIKQVVDRIVELTNQAIQKRGTES